MQIDITHLLDNVANILPMCSNPLLIYSFGELPVESTHLLKQSSRQTADS